MKDHKGDFRGYTHLKRAWYGKTCLASFKEGTLDEVTFGFYSRGGGTSGEMSMRWVELNREQTPQLIVWNDAWHTLWEFRNVIKALAEVDDQHITPEQFCDILNRCGFKDLTEVKERGTLTTDQS